MFILRRTIPYYGQVNTDLGQYYNLILREKNDKSFSEQVKDYPKNLIKKMFGIVVFDAGPVAKPFAGQMPLYRDSNYAILTGTGDTFDTISTPYQL